MDDYPFLSKDGSRLHIRDKVTWYSKRYKSWIKGDVVEMRVYGCKGAAIVTKITVKATYLDRSYPSWVVIKPSSTTKVV